MDNKFSEHDHSDIKERRKDSRNDSTLTIRSAPQEETSQELEQAFKDLQKGRDVDYHVINIESPTDLREIFSEKRQELIDVLLNKKYDSIRELARSLDRNKQEVLNDLNVLEKFDIIEYEQDGRAKQPFIPYKEIDINIRYSRTPAEA